MAAELGLLSLTQLQKLAQQQLQNSDSISSRSSTTYWMWNPKQVSQEQDDSWEVKAFEQDTSNITWPPRSYSCTFCRREFRSAQALGGHMNVHRRDRARLHQTPPTGTNNPTIISSSSSTLLIPAQEFVTNGGLCVLYSLPSPNGVLSPNTVNSCMDSPSNFLSTSAPFEANNLIPPCPPITLPQSINNSSICHESNSTEPSASNSNDNNIPDKGEIKKDSAIEELDLELRLGRR